MVHLERSFNHEDLFIFREVRFFLLNQPPSGHESVLSVGQEKVIHQGLSRCLWQGWWWEVWEVQLLQALGVCPVMSQSWARLVPSRGLF